MTNYSTLKSTGAPGFPPGFIIPWGHNSIPVGFLLCNGDPVSRTTYAVCRNWNYLRCGRRRCKQWHNV